MSASSELSIFPYVWNNSPGLAITCDDFTIHVRSSGVPTATLSLARKFVCTRGRVRTPDHSLGYISSLAIEENENTSADGELLNFTLDGRDIGATLLDPTGERESYGLLSDARVPPPRDDSTGRLGRAWRAVDEWMATTLGKPHGSFGITQVIVSRTARDPDRVEKGTENAIAGVETRASGDRAKQDIVETHEALVEVNGIPLQITLKGLVAVEILAAWRPESQGDSSEVTV